jgi:hypothetical protein
MIGMVQASFRQKRDYKDLGGALLRGKEQ